MTAGNIKQFDIERPTHQRLALEYIFCDFSPETFEPALGIVQPRQDQGLDQEVDASSAQMSVGRFVIPDGAFCFTRSDRNIKVLKCWRNKFNDLFYRHGEVGVTHKTIIPLCFEHPTLN